MNQDLERIAYHEAGHVVIAHYFGYEIEQVSILFNTRDNSYGNVLRKPEIEKDFSDTGESKISKEIALLLTKYFSVNLAGVLAEYIHDGKPQEMKEIGDYSGFGGDAENILNMIKAEPQQMQEPSYKIVENLIPEVIKILENKWPVVETIAKILIQKRTLTTDEVIRIIESDMI